MSLGFSYTFALSRPLLSAALQGLDKHPGLSDLELSVQIGVGGKKGVAYSAWLLYTGMRRAKRAELNPLGKLIVEADPFLQLEGTLALLHYNLSTNPLATVWWQMINKVLVPGQVISIGQAIDQFCTRGIGVSNLKNLKTDVRIFFRTYEASEALGSLGFIEQVDARHYLPRPISSVPPLVMGYGLYERRERGLRISTTSIGSLLTDDGQVGKVFLLTRPQLLERLTQLELSGLLKVSRMADVDHVAYTFEGPVLDIMKKYYEERA